MFWNKIDINVLSELYLPTFMRDYTIKGFVGSASKPLVELYDKTLYKMQHTGQVIYLEKLLNEFLNIPGYDVMDHVATRMIYISDAPNVNQVYIYTPIENKPLYLGGSTPVYLNRTEVQYHFIINIPESVDFYEELVRNLVDYYVIAGKQYKIETY